MRRSFRWLVTTAAVAGTFSLSWWCCEVLLGLSRGDAIGIAAVPSGLIAAPLGWWAGRELGRRNEKQPREWPFVESVDPLLLGVHKARAEEGFDPLPEYVPRDVDAQLQAEMRTAAEQGGFILLTGGSAAGKSRSAFAAMREVLQGHRVLSPVPGSDLRELATPDGTVLWLDDLEGHLGSDGLQIDLLNDLIERKVVIVATMRDEQYERFRLHHARKATDDDSRIHREIYLGAQVLNLATCVEVPRKWSQAETARASSSDDPRLHEALQHPELYAIPEYVAAGPQLLQEWKQAVNAGGHPRGAALVSAAVDLNRAGLGGAIPISALVDLHYRYLDENGGNLLRPESLDDAMAWASMVRYGITSLLLPAGKDAWRAFDYLVDSSTQAVPPAAWRAAMHHARTPRELHNVGISAYKSQHLDLAEEAMRAAAEQDDVHAMVNLGALLVGRGAVEEAELWTRQGASAGHRAGIFNLAIIVAEKGNLDEAKSLYAISCEDGNSDAAVNLANLYADEGDEAKAVALWRQAADMGNPSGLLNLAYHYRERRDLERYEDYVRRACDAGHPMAMNALGVLLAQRELFDEAEHWLRKAVDSDLAIAKVSLGLLFEQTGNCEEAESCYREADERGEPRGALRLGDLLVSGGRCDEGREWWNAAAGAGLAEAAARRVVAIEEPNGLDWIITEERTVRELDGLQEVCRNLWPVDCQTCGKPFSGRIPSLNVDDMLGHGYANLHHVTCHAPGWTEGLIISGGGNLSWSSICFLAEVHLPGGSLPVLYLMVNPGLEQVYLANDDSWRAATVRQFEVLGFLPSTSPWITEDGPVPFQQMPFSAHLTREEVAVTVYPGTTWSAYIDRTMYRLARKLGGVYVLVTTRILPNTPFSTATLMAELRSGNIAVRWFPFEAP